MSESTDAATTEALTTPSTRANALLSGAIAGLVCDVVVHPMDTVRTRLMMQTSTSATQYRGVADAFVSIVRNEGIRTLYRGAGVVWSFTIPAHAAYFLGYEAGKQMLEPSRSLEQKSAAAHFGAGVVAEVCGALIWTPMDVIKQRQQTHTRSATAAYATVPAAMRTIFREHGFRGFFTGIGAALATYAPFVGIYFVLYEQWKRTASRILDRTDAQLPFAVHLTGGAVAGGVSAYVTTPLDVVKTRFQTSVDSGGRNVHKSTIGTAVTIYRTEGLRSFMKGAAARVLWIAPGMAITIAVYEQSKRFLHQHCGLAAP